MTHRDLNGLHAYVTRRFEGFWSSGVPVGGECSDGPHAHQRASGHAAEVFPHLGQLRHAQLLHQLLGLHVSLLMDLQE